jgi:hypothetical protein
MLMHGCKCRACFHRDGSCDSSRRPTICV